MNTKAGLDSLNAKISELRVTTAMIALKLAIKRFNPNQPRWPAGREDGGQWRPAGGVPVAQNIGVYDAARGPGCLAQLVLDEEICRAAKSWRCWKASQDRYNNCMKGLFLPPLEVGR